ncbi:4-hydroxyphenylpyruvate dioxygenase (plasmid) [Sinorhizobium americanum CCGM7]|nr:4-hydroxyphenylpyruvate dioxygenase [Sinorhizobium americanum CCGM7]
MGIVLDINEVAKADDWRGVLPTTLLDCITYEDKVFFAPTSIHAEIWLRTSEALFRELGLKSPETWDEIATASARCRSRPTITTTRRAAAFEPALTERLRASNILYDRDEHGEYFHLLQPTYGEGFFIEIV